MKRIVLFLCTILLCFNVSFAQHKSIGNFAGEWKSDATTVQVNFKVSSANKLTMSIVDTNTKEKMIILYLKVTGSTVNTKEKFKSTNWVTQNKYYLKSTDTLINVIKGDPTPVVFYRVK